MGHRTFRVVGGADERGTESGRGRSGGQQLDTLFELQ
jgi:hypothetical protein